MQNLELEIYSQLLELLSEEYETTIKEMEIELSLLGNAFIIHNIPFNRIPYKTCPKCNMDLSRTMGYCCPNLDCPTGMGPVYCKT